MENKSLTLHRIWELALQTEVRLMVSLLLIPLMALLLLYPPLRSLVSPFIFGGIIAYLLYPLVSWLSRKLKIAYGVVASVIFLISLAGIILIITRIVSIGNLELKQLTEEIKKLAENRNNLPPWLQDSVVYLTTPWLGLTRMRTIQPLSLFEGVFTRVISLIAFIVSSYYLLQAGEKLFKVETHHQIAQKIDRILQNYLRGQLYLITIVTIITWIFLSFLKVKFAFLLSLFTGFAEIIPFVGPVTAWAMTIIITLLNSPLVNSSLWMTLLVISSGYLIIRQLEDFFVIPQILGRTTQLHPLVILFTTLVAGGLYGVLGLLIGVPTVAVYKVLLEDFLHKFIEKK